MASSASPFTRSRSRRRSRTPSTKTARTRRAESRLGRYSAGSALSGRAGQTLGDDVRVVVDVPLGDGAPASAGGEGRGRGGPHELIAVGVVETRLEHLALSHVVVPAPTPAGIRVAVPAW